MRRVLVGRGRNEVPILGRALRGRQYERSGAKRFSSAESSSRNRRRMEIVDVRVGDRDARVVAAGPETRRCACPGMAECRAIDHAVAGGERKRTDVVNVIDAVDGAALVAEVN